MIKLIFWVVILVLALSFFGISIQALINSPASQANIHYIFNLINQGWQWIIGIGKV